MQVFVIGSTGYIGNAISENLLLHHHEVIGLVRSLEAESQLQKQGIIPLRGDIQAKDSLLLGVTSSDAVVYAAASRQPEAMVWEKQAVETILQGMKGSNNTFIYTSGASVVGDTGTQIFDETYPTDPKNPRSAIESIVLSYANQGIRVIVIRPTFVYGRGQGILIRYMNHALEHSVAGYIHPGTNLWSFVHVDDLSNLYRLALESAPSGSIFNATTGDAIPMLSISEKISELTGATLTPWTVDEAASFIGGIAHLLKINLHVSGEKAVQQLNWMPLANSLYKELEQVLSKT